MGAGIFHGNLVFLAVVYNVMYNQGHQAELGKLSPFLKKHSKKSPTHPIRCGRRYV